MVDVSEYRREVAWFSSCMERQSLSNKYLLVVTSQNQDFTIGLLQKIALFIDYRFNTLNWMHDNGKYDIFPYKSTNIL